MPEESHQPDADSIDMEMISGDFTEFCNTVLVVLKNLGLDADKIPCATAGDCRIEQVRDDFDNETRILGTWFNAEGVQFANIVRYTNGNMFAEHDVLLPHPGKSGLFIEAIEVWGYAGRLKSDVRLLPAL